jgi:hypothetical protein
MLGVKKFLETMLLFLDLRNREREKTYKHYDGGFVVLLTLGLPLTVEI